MRKREELKRLKSLKMKEIREKLERIGREGGRDADDEGSFELYLGNIINTHAAIDIQ